MKIKILDKDYNYKAAGSKITTQRFIINLAVIAPSFKEK